MLKRFKPFLAVMRTGWEWEINTKCYINKRLSRDTWVHRDFQTSDNVTAFQLANLELYLKYLMAHYYFVVIYHNPQSCHNTQLPFDYSLNTEPESKKTSVLRILQHITIILLSFNSLQFKFELGPCCNKQVFLLCAKNQVLALLNHQVWTPHC